MTQGEGKEDGGRSTPPRPAIDIEDLIGVQQQYGSFSGYESGAYDPSRGIRGPAVVYQVAQLHGSGGVGPGAAAKRDAALQPVQPDVWSHYYSRVIHSNTCKAYKTLAMPNDYVANPFKAYKENILRVML